MEWISLTALKILGWMNTLAARPESILLAAIMLLLVLALAIGFVFALDSSEPRGIRIIGWLVAACSLVALGCGSATLLV